MRPEKRSKEGGSVPINQLSLLSPPTSPKPWLYPTLSWKRKNEKGGKKDIFKRHIAVFLLLFLDYKEQICHLDEVMRHVIADLINCHKTTPIRKQLFVEVSKALLQKSTWLWIKGVISARCLIPGSVPSNKSYITLLIEDRVSPLIYSLPFKLSLLARGQSRSPRMQISLEVKVSPDFYFLVM